MHSSSFHRRLDMLTSSISITKFERNLTYSTSPTNLNTQLVYDCCWKSRRKVPISTSSTQNSEFVPALRSICDRELDLRSCTQYHYRDAELVRELLNIPCWTSNESVPVLPYPIKCSEILAKRAVLFFILTMQFFSDFRGLESCRSGVEQQSQIDYQNSVLTPGFGRCERCFSQIQDLEVVQPLLRSP